MASDLSRSLLEIVDQETVRKVYDVADAWVLLRARAVETDGDEPVAWTLWDAPLAPILAAVGEAKRAAAAKALERPLLPR